MIENEHGIIKEVNELAKNVINETALEGQEKIVSQIRSFESDYDSIQINIKSMLENMQTKLDNWLKYEHSRNELLNWLKEIDDRLNMINLKKNVDEKIDQLNQLKSMKNNLLARELEIDTLLEQYQDLDKEYFNQKNNQMTDLLMKYQQINNKLKILTAQWYDFVNHHKEFQIKIDEMSYYIQNLQTECNNCSNFHSAQSQQIVINKLQQIQKLLLEKDNCFRKLKDIVDVSQIVLIETDLVGQKEISDAIEILQNQWSNCLSNLIETKSNIEYSINYSNEIFDKLNNFQKSFEQFEINFQKLLSFQSNLGEKKILIAHIKTIEEQILYEKNDVNALKNFVKESNNLFFDNSIVNRVQNIELNFDNLLNQVRNVLTDRQDDYLNHKKYKEGFDDLNLWLKRIREKIPDIKNNCVTNTLTLDETLVTYESIFNKKTQGELMIDNFNQIIDLVTPKTNQEGQDVIQADKKQLINDFHTLFNGEFETFFLQNVSDK